jgi:hypothetical protein
LPAPLPSPPGTHPAKALRRRKAVPRPPLSAFRPPVRTPAPTPRWRLRLGTNLSAMVDSKRHTPWVSSTNPPTIAM